MKKMKKVLLLVLCAALLVGATIAGTVAYLTSTASVENTFTAGNVAITMVESEVDEYGQNPSGTTNANQYKLIPGHTYTKDPTITVSAGSEDCYIFVEIVNGLGANAEIAMDKENWTLVEGELTGTSVWMCKAIKSAGNSVTPFSTFKLVSNADPSKLATTETNNTAIVVTAYAIQADSLGTTVAAEIWELFN